MESKKRIYQEFVVFSSILEEDLYNYFDGYNVWRIPINFKILLLLKGVPISITMTREGGISARLGSLKTHFTLISYWVKLSTSCGAVHTNVSFQARRHDGAFRGRAPQMTPCAPPSEGCAPKKSLESGLLECKSRPKLVFARIS